jgi:MioC protein
MTSAPVKITILVGTMTGTAHLVAQELELAWDDGETEVATLMMDGLDSSVFSRPGVFLVCTSTYGQGDVPDNAKALYADLQRSARILRTCAMACSGSAIAPMPRRSISAASGSTICLPSWARSAIGERVQHDASSGVLPEETAQEWGADWLTLAREACAQAV